MADAFVSGRLVCEKPLVSIECGRRRFEDSLIAATLSTLFQHHLNRELTRGRYSVAVVLVPSIVVLTAQLSLIRDGRMS